MALKLIEVAGSEFSVYHADKPILTYRYGEDLYKPYFHPVYAPNTEKQL